MQIYGKEIKDECSKCGEVLQCELFLQGHGIKRDRENVTEMVKAIVIAEYPVLCWHWICGREIKASRVYVACVWETKNGIMRLTTQSFSKYRTQA